MRAMLLRTSSSSSSRACSCHHHHHLPQQQQQQPHTSSSRCLQWPAARGRHTLRSRAADDDAPAAASSEASGTSTSGRAAPSAARELVEGLPKAFVSEEEWREMDKKVNKYPSQRTFTAIGTGGDDFAAAMQAAVEAVVGTVHVECVSSRPSSGGKYLSVRVGPVWVENADQVIAVFGRMRQDARLKWYM